MIELQRDTLSFCFPEVHPECQLSIDFQRTLRIPDDGRDYPLPPGLGNFPLRHVDDHANRVPERWLEHGGVMMPMYQAEALWLAFQPSWVGGRAAWPFAIKVATGKINAVTGEAWSDGIQLDPQDYMVAPRQPWLDGYCVEKGKVRQFVAMPLGSGYSAEEQITAAAEHGGVQIVVYPMKRGVFERRFPKQKLHAGRKSRMNLNQDLEICFAAAAPDMGLAPGGTMKQEIYDDQFDFNDWDQRHQSRCFVHLTNSMVWRAITGQDPPTVPPTAKEYSRAGLPWFDYYSDGTAVDGGGKLKKALKSIVTLGSEKGEVALPENESVVVQKVVALRGGLGRHQVREW